MALLYRFLNVLVLVGLGGVATLAQAQSHTIDLAAGGADQVWRGAEAGARAGRWLDQGAVSGTDARRDLIVGAPGDSGTVGRVYVLFGGPVRTGSFVMTTAETVITGALPGDLFGSATAAGNILNAEGAFPRNMLVGAPGALSGRGAVYLFAGGFHEGDSLTTANAVLTILGKTGDHLGAALATADLNNDGRREIVIGAPGTGRIYVINGSATLSGTIDLTTVPSNSVITGPGIGNVITAGNATGDNVYDLLIGAPEVSNGRGAVYLLAGVAGAGLPTAVSLPSGANATFTGADVNDYAGSSVRLGNIDGDPYNDILIGAPGGDGPTGGRTDAGEAYILWGNGSTPASLSLSAAPVTLFGNADSRTLGTFVTSGDINRDTPDDVVLLVPGPATSTGELAVYYGRPRNTIGVVQPDGRRFVDFDMPGQLDRRIVSDYAAGPLVSAQVYEVTGEGARDIIVSAPYAETDSGPLSGYVYFTISAKLTINPDALRLGAAQGGSASTSFQVQDVSSIEISWSATSDQPWLTVSPDAGTAVAGSPATVTVNASAVGLAPGSYSAIITVASTSRELEMSLPVEVTFNVLTAPTIAANRTFPVQATTPITWTVATTGGTGSFEYKFYRYKYGTGWTMVQDYGPSNAFSWTPGADDTGDYALQVWVRTTGATSSYEAYTSTGLFSITRAAPVMTSLTSNVGFPAATGTPITFTAQAIGGLGSIEYKFWRYKAGAGWTMVRDWATTNSHTWTPGGSDTGSYTVQAWVRNGGSTGGADDYRALEFNISNSAPVQVQSFTANRSFPSGTGTSITWTAMASGGSAGPLQFKFYRYNQGAGTWTMVQDYSSANTFSWTPGYNDAGSYQLQVWVRSAGSSGSYEAFAASSFSITRTPVTITSFTANRTFPVMNGTSITWTVQATGGSGALEYKFWRYKYGSGWTLVQDYGTSNTFTWTPGAGDTGTYVVQVWVRTVGSGVDLEVYRATDPFVIQ